MKLRKFHGIPWKSRAAKWAITKFHGIPWNSGAAISNTTEFHRIQLNFEIVISIDTRNLVLASSSMASTSMELSKFHGIPWNCPFDLEKFHGIPWNCEILILINFIIGEVYFIVCCMISCHCISDNPLVVEILRYFNSKATFWCPSFWLNGGILF